ncbi:MAG: AmmeMemoRadiSam system protein B [Patescibacteria group bacterium]
MEATRKAAAGGSFYPNQKKELRQMLAQFFAKTHRLVVADKLRALIVPHAGYSFSGQTAAWGFRQLPRGEKSLHLVLLGPSHYVVFSGLAASGAIVWETPLGKIKQLAPTVLDEPVVVDNRPHLPEHSLEVETPFLQYCLPAFSLTCLLTGEVLNWEAAADYLEQHFPHSLFVVSSDLSHHLPQKVAQEQDKATIAAILAGDVEYLLSKDNAACGLKAILILIALAKRLGWQGQLLAYDTSARASGETRAVVGYAALAFRSV